MNVLIAIAASAGLVLIYSGLTFEAEARNKTSLGDRADRLAADAGLGIGGMGLVISSVVLWLITIIVVAGVTGSAVVAGALSIGALVTPWSYATGRRARRRRMFREAWPDAIASLISGVRAGVSLAECCVGLVQQGPAELRTGFAAFAATYRAAGSFAAGLYRLREVMADPIADRVAVALEMAHQVGGTDLVRVLRALGDFVREDIRVRKEIEARWSWTVTAARVASAAPWIVLLLMATRPEAAAAYNSATGVMVVAGGALATVVGYRLMLRAARLPDERRLT